MPEGRSPRDLETRLGRPFDDQRLLRSALTHRSFLNERSAPDAEDNERLEFLGDALLDFVAGDYLYRVLPRAREGELTALRSQLVCEAALSRFARSIELGAFLRLGRGEEASGGRERPAMLCDAFEALVGAIYLDQGLEAAADAAMSFFASELPDLVRGGATKHAKSRLQELTQRLWQETPRYVTVAARGPDHDKLFVVEVRVADRTWATGEGPSKTEAARDAAAQAYGRIESAVDSGEVAGRA